MKIAVFGGSGFLGSHVADAAQEAGHETLVFDAVPSPWVREGQAFRQGDILDAAAVAEAMRGCDAAYNFAALADIEHASDNPVETVRRNVLGAAVLLDEARKAGVKRFVFASSIYVYSDAGSFYRSSKQAGELLVEDFQRAFGLPYTILRYGSLYGPRSGPNNFIHRAIRQALSEGKIDRAGNGEEIREYIHVADAARNSLDVLSPEYENQIVNLTGHHPIRVKDLLVMIREMLGSKVEIRYRPAESDLHYAVTPYSFNPRLGRKLVSNYYLDLGQGILSLMNEIHAELNENP